MVAPQGDAIDRISRWLDATHALGKEAQGSGWEVWIGNSLPEVRETRY